MLSIVFIIIGIASALYSAVVLKHGTTFDYIFTAWFWIASVFFGIQSVTYFLSFIGVLLNMQIRYMTLMCPGSVVMLPSLYLFSMRKRKW